MKSTQCLLTLALVVLLSACHKAPEPAQKTPGSKRPLTTVAFSTLSSSNTFLPASGWTAGANAHAEWFVPSVSGVLRTLEIAVEPGAVAKGRESSLGDLRLVLAQDKGDMPGPVLEQFTFSATTFRAASLPLPLVFQSAAQPRLQAGVRYWVCAGSAGPVPWTWHFNDQNLLRVSAREAAPGKWQSAGHGRNGAFRVVLTPEGERP